MTEFDRRGTIEEVQMKKWKWVKIDPYFYLIIQKSFNYPFVYFRVKSAALWLLNPRPFNVPILNGHSLLVFYHSGTLLINRRSESQILNSLLFISLSFFLFSLFYFLLPTHHVLEVSGTVSPPRWLFLVFIELIHIFLKLLLFSLLLDFLILSQLFFLVFDYFLKSFIDGFLTQFLDELSGFLIDGRSILQLLQSEF